ncbi:hypothetical protein [Limnoglobus roseus]|nr:hypothetical protein [Limnoglobus roseus]
MQTGIRSVILTFACCVLFAIAGGGVAVLLDAIAPGYYPGVFSFVHRNGGYASAYGKGVGAFQGLSLGFAVGVALSASLGWFDQLQLMPTVRSLGIIAELAGLAGIGGGLIGWGVGIYSPDYYRVVVSGGRESDFIPTDVGIGLGASQGIILGAVVGAALAIGIAWRQFRILSPNGNTTRSA